MSGPVPMADRARRVRNPYWVRAPVATAAVAALASLAAHSAGVYYAAPALTRAGLGDGAEPTRMVVSTIRRAPDRYLPTPEAPASPGDAPPGLDALAEQALATADDLPDTPAPDDLTLRDIEAPPDNLADAGVTADVLGALGDESLFAPPAGVELGLAPLAGAPAPPSGAPSASAQGLAGAALDTPGAPGSPGDPGAGSNALLAGSSSSSALASGAAGAAWTDDDLGLGDLGGIALPTARSRQDPLALPELGGIDAVALAGLDKPLVLDRDFRYSLQRLDPPDAGAGYFRVGFQAEPSLGSKLKVLPKDVVYVIDTSSSIPQDTVRACTAGVAEALATLNPGDRFNVVLFNEQVRFFDGSALLIDATPDRIAAATAFLRRAEPSGYTALGAAVRQLIPPQPDPGRVYNLVFISDGQPTRGALDTTELINTITTDNRLSANIYCVGVWGDRRKRPRRELLDFLAYRNGGFSIIAERRDDPAALIRQLAGVLRYPLIQRVEVRTAGAGLAPGSVFPKRLPTIHRGQAFEVFGRFANRDRLTVTVSGVSDGQPVDFTFDGDLRLADAAPPQLPADWARRKLHDLYDDYLRLGRPEALRVEIQRLGEAYDVETRYLR
ncbi:MAG: VWA domain-containing protein [Planctomycetota bacterium]